MSQKYAAPPVDPGAEKRSFEAHCRKYKPVPRSQYADEALLVCEELYREAHYEVPADWRSRYRILQSIDGLKATSSPGYPWCLSLPTNERLVEVFGREAIADMVEERLDAVLKYGVSVEKSLTRVFIKREPHKMKKIINGEVRLIWSPNVIDQLVDQMVYRWSLNAEIERHQDIPSKPGFTWFYGGADQLYKATAKRFGGGECVELDKSGWDWTVQAWYHDVDLEWRLSRVRGEVPVDWEHVMRVRTEHHKLTPVVFSDGTVLDQVQPGLMKSGLVNTLSTNSFLQVFIKVMYALSVSGCFDEHVHGIIAQGDDTLEKVPDEEREGYLRFIRELGHEPQDYHLGSLHELAFCSHRWRRVARGVGSQWVAVPTNWDKHSFALRWKEPRDAKVFAETVFSLCLEYAYDDIHFPRLHAALTAESPEKAYSRKWFQHVHLYKS